MFEFMQMFMIIFFVLFFVMVIVVIVKSFQYNKKMPRVEVRAKCVRKTRSSSKNGTSYYVEMLFPLGDTYRFSVKYKTYNSINEGDEDILMMKGTTLVSFGNIINESTYYVGGNSVVEESVDSHDELDSEKILDDLESETKETLEDYYDKSRY